jgi:nucleoside-diphosphate-sugar epimerase
MTDGEPVVFREFVTDLLCTRGIDPPDRTLPLALGRALAGASETLWRALALGGAPPLSRTAIWLSSLEVTIDISKACAELGYDPPVPITGGLERLRVDA